MAIPAAKAAVEKEWDKLDALPAWDFSKVQPKAGSGLVNQKD